MPAIPHRGETPWADILIMSFQVAVHDAEGLKFFKLLCVYVIK